MAEFYFREIKKSFDIDEQDKDKYLVFTCAKNESKYIQEWVEHYLSLGFDKIILADNNDTNDMSLEEVLKNYVKEGTVQILDCRGMASIQVPMYADFCEHGNYKWCAYFDCDEFLEICNYKSVKEYLSTLDCDCLCINWLMFGPNGQYHETDGKVQDRFPLPQMPILYFRDNCFLKSIVRGGTSKFGDCWFNGSHIPFVNEGEIHYSIGGYKDVYSNKLNHTTYPFHYKQIYLKHYYTKSFDEWIEKSGRGWPDNTPTLNTSNYFIFNENIDIPTSYLYNGIFDAKDKTNEEDPIANIKHIMLSNSSTMFIYPIIHSIIKLLSTHKDKVFGLVGMDIDDSLFNIFLEYAYKTDNKIIYCSTEEDFWRAIEKYPSDNGAYYKITFN